MKLENALDRTLLIKWSANLLLPVISYFLLLHYSSLNSPQSAFIAVTVWAVCAWIFNTLSDAVVGLLLPILYVICCTGVNMATVYAPWRGDVWIIVVSGFILGKLISESGLGRRIALSSVKLMGNSFSGALFGFMIGAILLSPLIPSILARGAILMGVAISFCQALDFKPKSKEATALLLGTCIAVGSSKMMWLTGAADMTMGMDLVDKTMGIKTTWMEYAIYNFPPVLIYIILSMILVLVVLRTNTSREEIREIVNKGHSALGPMTRQQKWAVWLIIVLVLGMITDKFHGISAGAVMAVIVACAFLPGVNLMNDKYLKQIDFTPLFFVMGCMAIGSTGASLKVTQWVAQLVLPLFQESGAFVASLSSYLVGVGVNFLFTPLAATATLTTPITELGLQMGLDPRILYFSFQYGLDNIIFPYEFVIYLYFFSSGYINFKQMVLVMSLRIVMSGIFVACCALPYWQMVL